MAKSDQTVYDEGQTEEKTSIERAASIRSNDRP